MAAGSDDFRDFVAARSPAVLRTATLLAGGDLRAGEDLLQDALAEVFRRWHQIEDQQAREAYTRRILVRMATKTWGRRARERQGVGQPTAPAASPEQASVDRLDMRRYLAALPVSQRVVLVLRYYDDLSEAQIAELVGCRPARSGGGQPAASRP